MMKDVFLAGPTVNLRPVSIKDAKVWYRWFNDPNVIHWMEKKAANPKQTRQVKTAITANFT